MATAILPPLPVFGCDIRCLIDFPGYAVTEEGIVLTCHRVGFRGKSIQDTFHQSWHPLKPYVTPVGYCRVTLCVDGILCRKMVHQIVLEAFIGPCPDGMEGCHKNGNPGDNNLSNLYWGTPKQNAADRTRHGRTRFGEANNKTKLRETQIQEIFRLYMDGWSTKALSEKFNVCDSNVWGILKRKTWKHVVTPEGFIGPRKQQGPRHHYTTLIEVDIIAIRRLYERGHTEQVIADLFNVTRATIGYILTKKTWKHVV